MKSLRKRWSATLVGVGCALLLMGCSSPAQETAEVEEMPEEVTEPVATYRQLGVHVEGDVEVLTTNNLGSAITALALKSPGDAPVTTDLLPIGETIAANETVTLCVPAPAEGTTEGLYELTATMEAGGVYTFPGLDLGAYKDMTLVVNGDDLAFVDYTTAAGQQGTTEQASLDAVNMSRAIATPEAEGATPGDGAVGFDATTEPESSAGSSVDYDYSYESTPSYDADYDYDYSYEGETSGGEYAGGGEDVSGGEAPSQSEDSCINPDDIVMRE